MGSACVQIWRGGGTSLAWQGPRGVRQMARTSPRGCDCPGSTPGADLFLSPGSGASQWAGVEAARTALATSYVEKLPMGIQPMTTC
jgi:hypothetical protein